MMIIAPNSRAHKGNKERGEVKGEYGGVCGEEEGNADYGGMVQPSQQHAPFPRSQHSPPLPHKLLHIRPSPPPSSSFPSFQILSGGKCSIRTTAVDARVNHQLIPYPVPR